MFGRLGSLYFLHLAEAQAQRRRLVQADRLPYRSPAETNLGVFLRLFGVIALGLGAAGVVSMMAA